MNDNTPDTDHNFVIKVICIIGLINASQMLTLIFSPMTKHLGIIFPAFFVLSVVISLICIVGLWLLKKWAAVTYSVLLIFNQIALVIMGYWEFTALIVPAVIIALLYKYRDKMS
ncbi:hypothetical protein MCAMS1_02125 [biofilm metagenome]